MISYRKKSFVVHVEAEAGAEAGAGAEAEAATKRLVGLTSALGLVGDADALGVLFKVTDQPLSSKAYTRVKGRTYLRALHTSLLKNLLENIILLGVLAKLVLKLLLAGRVEDTLLAVFGDEHLPPSHNVNHGNRAISLPLLKLLYALDEDAELVAGAALVEDLGLGGVAAGHFV